MSRRRTSASSSYQRPYRDRGIARSGSPLGRNALRAQHAELQQAYRKIEESSATLKSTMRKFQIVRVGATCLVIALFVAAGVYSWGIGPDGSRSAPDYAGRPGGGSNLSNRKRGTAGRSRTVTVRPRPLTSSISVDRAAGPVAQDQRNQPNFRQGVGGSFSVRADGAKGRAAGRAPHRRDQAQAPRRAQGLHQGAQGLQENFRIGTSNPEMSQARRALTKAQVALRKPGRISSKSPALLLRSRA